MATKPKNSRSPETVKIAQLNAQNSRQAIDDIRVSMTEMGIDAIALQEPYNSNGVIRGLGLTTKIILDTKTFTSRVKNRNPKSAIAVRNPEIKCLKLEHLCSTHFTCVEIVRLHTRFYLISAYMQYSDPIRDYLQQLEKILETLQGEEVIICIDANATSTSWHRLTTSHSGRSEQRGEELDEFIAQHRLIILNRTCNAPTFDNLHGQSNIDVTIATTAIASKVRNWRVHPNKINSDHRLITFEIACTNQRILTTQNNRFNMNRADWDAFRAHIRQSLNWITQQHDENTINAQTRSEIIDQIILNAGNATIPKKRIYSKSVPWWNQTLRNLREKVFEARHRLQRTRDETARKRLLSYKKLRIKYSAEIKKAKQDSWKKFTKRLKLGTVQSNISIKGTQTNTWDETVKTLLNALVPNDEEANESAWHRNIRKDTREIQGTADSPPFAIDEIAAIINSLITRKAPGHDLIDVKIIEEAWPEMQVDIVEMLNGCLAQMLFPRQYKTALIRVLLKADDKDKNDPKSYRPISLLPVMGKILERAIAGRLKLLVNSHPRSAERQYGFRIGKSTEDAILELHRIVGETRGKYAVGLLFDISGAFDNVWWPSILANLKDRDCPKNLYGLVRSYLEDRCANIIGAEKSLEKNITKGCPQGSVLGPLFWNLIFDEAIEITGRSGNGSIAFADDLIVVVSADSRSGIETKANEVTRELSEWCKRQKLQISETKTEMILLKGFLDIKRPPIVKIGDKSLKMNSKVRYLGVHFGTRLNVTPHVDYITTKTRNIFSGLVKLAKAHWGLNTKIIRIIYKGLVLAILCYAAAGWAGKLNLHHHRKLRSAQRQSLLAITRAYRTTSNSALTVLAAEPPIHLVLRERIAYYYLRKNLEFQIGNIHYIPSTQPITESKTTSIKNRIRDETIKTWQSEWDTSEQGGVTRAFFRNISRRMQLVNIGISHNAAQIITGHGRIKSTLHRLKLSESDQCRCGQPDTVEHIVYDCKEDEVERKELQEKIRGEGVAWPCTLEEMAQERTLGHLCKFAEAVIKKREDIEKRHPNN
ncbi:hypothetical protein QLX08_010208 [Tetragonisca angustula]|uniref:Reverse transcriptase domain-containing protein n=1 Tax=Tetragonisca angustula TaxID=166442 RepID=A0AAW0ZF64_9HYME